ncbi:hypothetical protein N9N67_09730 [Bacteriovoracaceae bacterium]|nr:hypothetical protein [Bacteriovoracaceae bacterium]
MKTVLSIVLSLMVTHAFTQNKWDGSNSPTKIGKNIERLLNNLPKKADLNLSQGYGWSGSYWPSETGGIAFRWNHPTPNNFKYSTNNLEKLRNMSQEELNQLSPAEKYDIFMGQYNYPTVKRVWRTTIKSAKRDWAGICHGWAQAALNLIEPAPVNLTNADGITLGFGSSDVKALLSHYFAYGYNGKGKQIGRRCYGKWKLKGDCKDVHPASFHLALTNMIGIQKKGFIADVDRYKEVWNQPVVGYEYIIKEQYQASKKARKKGVYTKAVIEMKMTYADELQEVPGAPDDDFKDFQTWKPVFGTVHNEKTTKTYNYVLELSKSGKIIGGTWRSKDRPDFLWFKTTPFEFDKRYIGLKDIYRPIQL